MKLCEAFQLLCHKAVFNCCNYTFPINHLPMSCQMLTFTDGNGVGQTGIGGVGQTVR